MAKKSRKQTRKSSSAPTRTVRAVSSGRSFDRDFNPDYTPVINDLRRIGILAGSFIVVLVILSFFL